MRLATLHEEEDEEEMRLCLIRPIIDPWPEQDVLTMPPLPQVYMARPCKPALDDAIDRTVGTAGFLGGVMVYFGFCCCLCSPASQELRETYNGHTLCGLVCPLP